MNLTVLVEQVNAQKYRAETAQPIALVAEGSSRDEAVDRLRKAAQDRLAAGELVRIEIQGVSEPHPWLPFAGIWKDNPDVDSVMDHIAEHRRQIDEAEAG